MQHELRQLLNSKETIIQDLQQSFLLLETQKMKEVQDLKRKTEEVKDANG